MSPVFPAEVFILMIVEFAERVAYYGTTFMLMTYCVCMLRWGPSAGNALINVLYVLSPVSACISSGLADGWWGRPYSLVIFLMTYAVGLFLVAISSFPFFYGNFPLDPSVGSFVFFVFGILLFATGYGGMKVCTNPLLADSVSEAYKDDEVKKQVVISQLFRWIYCVTNAGSLVGIFVPPLLRGIEKRYAVIGSVTYTTGYYIGFSFSAISCILGLLLFVLMYRRFQRNKPSPTFVLARILFHAIRIRWCFAIGKIRDDIFLQTHRWDLIDYAGYPTTTATTTIPTTATETTNVVTTQDITTSSIDLSTRFLDLAEGEKQSRWRNRTTSCVQGSVEEEVKPNVARDNVITPTACKFDAVWVTDAKSIGAVCRALIAMPIYWLIANQFSTTVILQATAMYFPMNIPPEVLNNVNVAALLISLVIFDRVVFPFFFRDRAPPVRGRVVCGFVTMILSLLWCGFLQLDINSRGSYDNNDYYHLHPQMEMLPALWLVPPYIMQGVASALVDTTIMEVAYVAAPTSMKGTMMALYLIASSLSGFLGLVFSPVMKPRYAHIIIFTLAGMLFLMTILFYFLNRPVESSAQPVDSHGPHVVNQQGTTTRTERDYLLDNGINSVQGGGPLYTEVHHDREVAERDTARMNILP